MSGQYSQIKLMVEKINNIESEEPPKNMECGCSDKSEAELNADGWEEEWSFHARIREQWNDACDKVRVGQASGDWKFTAAHPDHEGQKKDGIWLLFKRKTEQRKDWDKEKGY